MQRIDHAGLLTLLESGGVTLVDALPRAAYEGEHLPGAVNVPERFAPDLAARLVPDQGATVVVHCSGPACSRSRATAVQFERLGYRDVRVYPGGKLDWSEAGLPLEGPTSTTRPHAAHPTKETAR
jgi:rhodanese-related sulfurtransferase